jgi:DNA-binding transcriptional ArsR family regulator
VETVQETFSSRDMVKELSCGAIGMALGLSPSLISHHLGVLESASLIERRKDGLWTLNSLRRDELSRRLSGLERLVRPAVAS